jgi:hypothetical protein
MQHSRLFTAAVLGTAISGGALFSALTVTPAQATTNAALTCKASVSNAKPKDSSIVNVFVTTLRDATVTTAAHYKSTTTTHTGTATSAGKATIEYKIGHATAGFKVVVDVKVKSGSSSGSCTTFFTPTK